MTHPGAKTMSDNLFDAAEAMRVAEEMAEDDERATGGPWRVVRGDVVLPDRARTKGEFFTDGIIGPDDWQGAPLYSTPENHPAQIVQTDGGHYGPDGATALSIARLRNNAKSAATQLRAAIAEVERLQGFEECFHEQTAELVKTIADRDRLSAEVERLRGLCSDLASDFDEVLAAHDHEHPRHRSKGGQHHNGPCCSFGNVQPGAVREFRFLRDRINAALEKKETP